jgi:ribosomal protein S18 acetylase RimI-like enzyme
MGTMFDWIREVAPRDQDEVQVHSGCPANGDAQHRRLVAEGFQHERTFWEMTGRVTTDTRRQPPVAGLTVEPTRDAQAMHRVLNEGFIGHWGFEPMSFDEWLAVERSSAGYDPELWRLARIDGTPAAAMVLTRRAATEGALYIAELATLAPYRGRGIASALLAHAFDVAAEQRLDQVWLHVDSENANNAPSVYRRAGFDVRSAFDAFTRSLTTGVR